MQFTPKTKQELETMNLLPPGVYHFQVANAKEQTSKNGNEMIALTLTVFDDQGAERVVYDYLLEAIPTKLFAFCFETGMESRYHNGTLTAQDCIGKSAYVELTISKGGENPNGGTYPDKNVVKKYTNRPIKSSDTSLYQAEPFDDGIPF